MSNVTGAKWSIMGGQNEQAYLRSHNDRQIRNFLSKQRIGKANSVPEPPADNVVMNEADINADTCCLGPNFIPLAYNNRSAYVYPYNDAHKPI